MNDKTNVSYSTDIKHEALQYVKLGLPVIPLCPPTHENMDYAHRQTCKSPGKTPVLKKWTEHTSTTIDDIHRWFNRNQYLNIGLPLGSPSKLIGIDIDGASGEKILQELSKGELPDTWEFTTGKGRRLLYKMPEDMQTKKVKFAGKKPHEEFAIICDGQQTVLPPSRHASSRLYAWKIGPNEMTQPAIAPKWIIDKIQIDENGIRVSEEIKSTKQKGERIKEDDWNGILILGERNDEITRRAGWLLGRGMSKDATLEFLSSWNKNHCNPPLPDKEIETIVSSISIAEEMKKSKRITKQGEIKYVFKPTPFAKLFINNQDDLGYSWRYSAEISSFFRCNNLTGPWERLELDYVRKLMRNILRDESKGGNSKWDSIHYVNESIEALKSELVTYQDKGLFDLGFLIKRKNYIYDPLKIIVTQNGVLQWEDLSLTKWSPDIYTTIMFPVEWKENADCPYWQEALHEWIPEEETIKFLQEFVGLCLIPDTSFRIAVFLYGTGSNGKSMFLETIRDIFGDGVVSIPLHRIMERFETANLQNKLINICGDIDAKYISDTGVLKSLITGDPIRGEYKHGKQFDFTPVCRLIFSANSIPTVSDKSVGWYSRWKFVEFPNFFPTNPSWKMSYSKLFEKEKSGIFKWAVDGLRRLKNSNEFTSSKKMKKSFEIYKMQNDNVLAFMNETMSITAHVGEKTMVPTKALHNFYHSWLQENLAGSRAVSQVEFTKRIMGMNIEKSVRKIKAFGGKNAVVFLGIKPKEKYLNDYNEHLYPLRME